MDFVASLTLITPELILSVSGLVLLLVAAWAGDRSSTVVTVLAERSLDLAGAAGLRVQREMDRIRRLRTSSHGEGRNGEQRRAS